MKFSTLFFLILAAVPVDAAGEYIRYSIDGITYEGYLAVVSADAPSVIIVHDWDGLTDYEIKRADMLFQAGYSVFAVDLFGAGIRPTELEGKQKMTKALYNDRAKMRRLLQGAIDFAKSKGVNTTKAVASGYCIGGAAVLELARSGVDLKGFVTFHGGLETPQGQDYSKTKGQILVLHGTADESVTMHHFAQLAAELESNRIPHEMITYSGAPHAFTVFGTDRYREDADRKSWNRFMDFLKNCF